MEALWVEPSLNNQMEQKWSKMVVLSLFFHVAIFCMALFVPDHAPSRRIRGPVYEVNLVEMPKGKEVKVRRGAKSKTGKSVLISKKSASAKRISTSRKKAKPIVVAKRTVAIKRQKAKKPEVSPSKLIEQALSKIKKKVETQNREQKEETHIEQAISGLETRSEGFSAKGGTGRAFSGGLINWTYLLQVEDHIKENWSYPVASISSDTEKNLEAVIVLKVKSNRKIMEVWFQKRSSNVIFDQSVKKAVERSDPLPHFPPGYKKTHDEIEINFNLTDLKGF